MEQIMKNLAGLLKVKTIVTFVVTSSLTAHPFSLHI